MSAIDRHVVAVQNKLALRYFVRAAVWTLLAVATAACAAVALDRLLAWRLPMAWVWAAAGTAAALAAAAAWALHLRPDRHRAAVAIDEKLHLQEKFSTALFARAGGTNPFAAAVVRDAEQTAQKLKLHRQFPLEMPKAAWGLAAALAAGCALWWLPPMDLLGKRAQAAKAQQERVALKQQQDQAAETLRLLAQTLPQTRVNDPEIKSLQGDLENMLKGTNLVDAEKTSRKAMQALEQVHDDVKQEAEQARQVADQASQSLYNSISPTSDKGPVADMQRDIRKQNFDGVQQDLKNLQENFDKMSQQEKDQAQAQMQNLANQLQKMANDPAAQKKMEQAIQQQLGVNQPQAQQIAKTLQQAANGDAQAQQQVQQMAQQAMQQMNGGKGPSAQQQQQIQQAMSQLQGMANNQTQASAMGQGAQQLAQAMRQAAQGQAGQPQGGAPQQGQAGANQGQAPGQQQGQGQQAQGGQKPGQGQGNQGGQQMAAAAQSMSAAVSDMRAQQQAAGQLGNMQQGLGNAMANMQGGQGQGQQAGQNAGQGQWGQGQPGQQPGQGQGGPGIGAGGNIGVAPAPYTVTEEQDPSKINDKGRVLARQLVKDNRPPEKGEAKLTMLNVLEAAQKDAPEEVDNDHVSGAAQKVAEKYFQTMEKDDGQ